MAGGEAATMQLFDLLIEAETKHVDWCTDPSDLERALARRLMELEPHDEAAGPVQEKLAETRLARELGRVIQH
jgi:hypothetical protein